MKTRMHFKIYILIVLKFVLIFCNKSFCPDHPKCNCLDAAKKITVECTYLENVTQLGDIFKKDLISKSVALLKLPHCSATTVTKMAFSNASIQSIHSTCPFKNMAESSLSSVDSLRELQLLSTKFKTIPKGIGELKNLKILQITNGELTGIYFEIYNMSGLVKLFLKNNYIRNVSRNAFARNPDMKVIDLSENRLVYIEPGTFDSCQKLEQISLQKNRIKSVVGLFGIPKLQEINLRNNNLRRFEGVFHSEIELKTLNLGENPLSEITDQAFGKNIKYLRTLILDKCKLVQLPSMLFQYQSELQEIYLNGNKLEAIPAGIFHDLGNLVELDLSNNKIRNIDGAFLRNDRLQKIVLSGNILDRCGDLFHNMQSLQIVDLRINHLQAIENGDFSSAPSLKKLRLGTNSIDRIDSDAFIHLKQLENLTLDFNAISSLNGSVRDLPELQLLLLHSNKLKEIGEYDMLNLPYLKRLNLRNNFLVNVQGAFRKLDSMTSLTISQNKLTTLTRSTFPEKFKIEKMFLSGNKWQCDCRLSWLRDWMIRKHVHGLKHDLQCSAPPEFQSKILTQLTALDLSIWPRNCDVEKCECTCVAQDVGYYVRVDCSNKGLSKAPPIFPDAVGELLLQNNFLKNPIKLNISNSAKLKLLNMEKNYVTEIDFYLPNNIQTLMLAGNNFTRFKAYFPPSIITWTLSGNPWICDCDAVPFWKFITSIENTILDRNSTRCSFDSGPEETRGKLLIELTEMEICPPSYIVLYASLAAVLVTISALAIVSHLGYRRYRYHIKVWLYSRGLRWLKKKDDRDKGKYDAYLAFSDEDVLFVRQHILPELEEKEPHYSVYVPQRNLIGGEFKINSEIENATKSKRMIVLLSQNYIQDELRMEVFRVMHTNCLEEQLYRIILVFLTDLPPLPDLDPSLRTAIEATRCLRFGQKLFWDMLRFAMPDIETDKEEDEENDYDDTPLISA